MFVPMRSLVSWVRRLLRSRPAARRRASPRPSVEELEDRLAPAGGLPPGAWPTFEQNNLRTGDVAAVPIVGPAVLWTTGPLGPEGSPTIPLPNAAGNTTIYSAGVGTVYENDNATGTGLGQVSQPTNFLLTQVLSTPTVDADGNVYVSTANTVQAISPAGVTLWNFAPPAPPAVPVNITTDPLVPTAALGLPFVLVGGAQVQGVDGAVYAIDTATGAPDPGWTPVPLQGTPVSISEAPPTLLGFPPTVFVMTSEELGPPLYPAHGTYIYALNEMTGAIEWWVRANDDEVPLAHDAIVANPNLLPAAPAPYLYYINGAGDLVQASQFDGHTLNAAYVGLPQWTSLNLDTSLAAGPDGILYATSGASITAFDAVTLAPLWSFSTSQPFNAPALAVAAVGDDALYVMNAQGNLYAIDAFTGVEMWDISLTTAGPPQASATVIDGAGDIIVDIPNVGVVDVTGGGAAVITNPGVTTYPGPVTITVGVAAAALGEGDDLEFGENDTVTANVSPAYTTTAVPTGSVNFFANGALLGNAALDASGDATLETSDLPVGSYTVTAFYSGDPNFYANNNGTGVTINPGDTTTDLSISAADTPSTYGDAVTLSSTVAPVDPANGTPTGTVTFSDGSTVIGTATLDSSDNASVTVNNIPAGDDTITASYSGDGNFNSSTSAGQDQNVNPAYLVITATDFTMTYADVTTLDGTTGFTSSGLLCGDAIDSVTLSTDATISSSGNWNAGPWTITASAATGADFNPSNYSITYVPGTLTVNPAILTVTGVTGSDKTYDGTTTDPVAGTPSLSGVISGDDVNLDASFACRALRESDAAEGLFRLAV